MKARLATGVLLGFVLVAAASCGGSDGLSTAEEEALQERLEAAELEAARAELEAQEAERLRQAEEAAREEAERQAAEAERLRLEEEAARQKAEEEAAEAERLRLEEEAAREEAEQRAEAAEEDAEEAQQQAEQAQQQQQQLQQQQQQLQQQQQQQQQQLQQQLTEAEQAELRARADSFGAQLDAPVEGSATVSWRRGDTTLTFRPTGITTTRGSAAPSVPGGWRSASFDGQTGTATTLTDETVYLYTNIQAPSSRNFWKVHAMTVIEGQLEVAAASAADLNTDADNNDPTPTAAAQYITDPADNTLASGVRVSGTYDGVSGTFTCRVPTTCTGERTNVNNNQLDLTTLVGAPVNGVRSFVAGDWSFKPGSINTRVKAEDQADQDDAFLYFGVWSSIPDNINGTTYDFKYVIGGGHESGTALANFGNLTGSATFRGGAVGKYTTQGQVGGQNAKIGTFTATATLNANFSDPNDAAAGTLSGSITDFREDGSPLAGWRVTLGGGGSPANVGIPVDITLADNADDASGITVANIGGLSVAGTWGANFYGSDNGVIANNPIFADRDKYPVSQYPVLDLAGVAGWFNAVGAGTNDTSLAGAFAATRSSN